MLRTVTTKRPCYVGVLRQDRRTNVFPPMSIIVVYRRRLSLYIYYNPTFVAREMFVFLQSAFQYRCLNLRVNNCFIMAWRARADRHTEFRKILQTVSCLVY